MCHDVAIEPPLIPLTGESITPSSANHRDNARAGIHARGFWGRRQSAFFDIRVFHPYTFGGLGKEATIFIIV